MDVFHYYITAVANRSILFELNPGPLVSQDTSLDIDIIT